MHESNISRNRQHPQEVHKAECWLRPIAQHATADSDVEAAVYFASRGHKAVIDVNALRDSWHSAICIDIEEGIPVKTVPQNVLKRARSRSISLAEAAEVLRFNQSLPRFFFYRVEEEDFIDAAMFRAVEWLGIPGFDPWLKSLLSDLSLGPQGGIDHGPGGWRLFNWCRSDLALQMAERQGLEAWLWALINGHLDRENPWRFMSEQENQQAHDFLPLCGIILFVWYRIKPKNMKQDILQRATDLLLQTQMRCGAWPLYTDDSRPCLMTTCAAIHGLALHRPRGWEQLAERGAKWIVEQQNEEGYWHIGGGPPVMLTVLALDTLVLSNNGGEVTFSLDADAEERIPDKSIHKEHAHETLPLCKPGTHWEDIEITLVSKNTVRIKTPDLNQLFNFHQLDLADGRSGNETLLWQMFDKFALNNGFLSGKNTDYDHRLTKNATRLNKHLQKLFGIDESIYCAHYRKEGGYRTKFKFKNYSLLESAGKLPQPTKDLKDSYIAKCTKCNLPPYKLEEAPHECPYCHEALEIMPQ